MTTMQEHAIAIARVSSVKQREEDQRPGLVAYAERKGYTLDEMVPVHGRSAFHGKHVKAILAAVDKHVRHGGATVVIFRHVDRSSRQGVFEGFDLLKKIMDAGARVEFSEQEYLTDQPGMIGMFFDMAKRESEVKRDRKLQGNRVKKANGELVGRTPWGYDPVLKNGVQVGIAPNALGRKWIPVIFTEAVAGKSLRAIQTMLAGIPSPQKNSAWNEASIRRVIANTTYYGSMTSNPNMKIESLVSVELHKQANLAVAARIRRGGPEAVKNEPTLVRPFCGGCWGKKREGAPSGKSPMYRVNSFGKYSYYACKGHGAARKSCGGPVIPVADLDKAIDELMAADAGPHMVPEYVAGDDSDEQRSVINEKIRVALEAGDYMLMAQLGQEAMQIGPSVRKSSIEMVDSGITVGRHWESLSPSEKRDELKRWTVIAYPDKVDMFRQVLPGGRSRIADIDPDAP
jgi:DNA invertase Pin-like site-specific DNA recombinase